MGELNGGWPIPVSRDNEGMFCDLAEEGAQTGLLALMTGISEETWAAGWMHGIEYSLWRAAEHGHEGTEATERQARLLKLLSEEANGWWYYHDMAGARFVRLDEWRAHVASLASKQA